MKPKARFIRSIIAAAQECDTVLPYARQYRRAEVKSVRLARSA